MFRVVLFKILSVEAVLLVDISFWNSFSIIWIECLVTVLRAVFDKVTLHVAASADVSRTQFVPTLVVSAQHLVHLWSHHLSHWISVHHH